MWLAPETCGLEHDIPAGSLEIDIDCDAGSLIELEESHGLVWLQGPRVLHSLCLPLTVVICREFMEGSRHLEALQIICHEDESPSDRVSTAPRCQLRPDGEFIDCHGVSVEVLEKELWSGVVRSEDLVVVQDYRVHLVGVVKLGSSMLVDDQRQEAGRVVLWPRELLRS